MRRSALRTFPRTTAVVLFVAVSAVAQVQTLVDLTPTRPVAATEGVAAAGQG